MKNVWSIKAGTEEEPSTKEVSRWRSIYWDILEAEDMDIPSGHQLILVFTFYVWIVQISWRGEEEGQGHNN
jgi:hypothetical protein